MRHVRSRLAALTIAAAIAGCSGSSNPTSIVPATAPQQQSSSAGSPGAASSQTGGGWTATLPTGGKKDDKCAAFEHHRHGHARTKGEKCVVITANFELPHRKHVKRKGEGPNYVSPSTNGLTWIAYLHGTQTIDNQGTDDVSSGSPLCTTGSPRTCSIPFAVDGSVGGTSYDFVLTLYDQKPVAGSIPNGANVLGISDLTATVFSNQANTFTFVVDGVWVTTNPVVGGSSVTYESEPANGSAQSMSVTVQGLDADGNIITGAAPYYSPLPVSIAETGGSGHSSLSINGAAGVASGNLAGPSDTLAIKYDGGGAVGYTSLMTAGSGSGGTSTLRVSPMYITPATAGTVVTLSSSPTSTVATEKSAPAGIAYNANVGTCTGTLTPTVTGSGASATTSFSATIPAGTAQTCNVTISDILGTSMTYKVPMSVSGPISITANNFPTGGGGTCSGAYAFTAAGQTAVITVSDPLYTGTITGGSSRNTVATVAMSGSGTPETATVTAVAAGTATLTLSDTTGNTKTCSIGVTTSGGGVSFIPYMIEQLLGSVG